jgi:hypothetical protein
LMAGPLLERTTRRGSGGFGGLTCAQQQGQHR